MAEPQREWFDHDYYKTLGVSQTASAKEITKAYRKLARKLHPDANPGDAKAEDQFKEVSSAYDVLGDDDKRKSYDEVRRLGPMAGGFGMPGGRPGGQPGGFNVGMDDIGDMLGGLFGRGGRRNRGGQPGGPRKGADLEADLHLDFEDAVSGLETTIHLTSDATCSTCSGVGAEPGSSPHRCPQCSGSGTIDQNQGFFSFSQPCPTCNGRGNVIDKPCHTCQGSGIERRPRDVKVRIPAGVKDHQKIRLKGRGGPGSNSGPPGDLYITALVAPHALFGRSGKDLTLTVPITFAEAALGADIKVPTIDHDSVTIRIPAGTRNGRTFRVKGRGVGGDLLVTVEVAVPQHLDAKQRKAIEQLDSLTSESPRAYLGV